MPKLNIEVLISHLEDIDEKLGILWAECQNYDLLSGLEEERKHLRRIIETLEWLLKAGQGGSPKPLSVCLIKEEK
jgi:hypothetical protein